MNQGTFWHRICKQCASAGLMKQLSSTFWMATQLASLLQRADATMLMVSLVPKEGETQKANNYDKLPSDESQKHQLDKQAAPYKSYLPTVCAFEMVNNSHIRLTARSETVFLIQLTRWAAANLRQADTTPNFQLNEGQKQAQNWKPFLITSY
jgi:hypothetical protein